MPTVLMVWELGGGLGHVMQLAPLARSLIGCGHAVFASLRDLSRVDGAFGRGAVSLLPAPWKVATLPNPVRPPLSLAHILHNLGWADDAELRSLCEAWRTIYRLVRPDVVVFDHAPTALLAS